MGQKGSGYCCDLGGVEVVFGSGANGEEELGDDAVEAEQQDWAEGEEEDVEQQAGTEGFGAETPAVLEPRPSFWRLRASSLPVGSRPLADWNFCMAATVFGSHFPLGSAW